MHIPSWLPHHFHIEVNMRQEIGRSAQRFRVQLLSLAALALLTIAPLAARAEAAAAGPGAGTLFKECYDQSWLSYNSCLVNSDGSFDRFVCDLAWEMDLAFCGAEYVRRMRTGRL